MSVVSNIAYLFRSYSSILGYMNDKERYEKKVKLTNKSYDNLSKRVHDSFATLHEEKRGYREEISNIEEELAAIKEKMLNSSDKLEQARLKMEYNKKKIEHKVKLNLLPRRMKKVTKKMEKFVNKSRKEAINIESKRPIMISEDLKVKISNIANMLAPILGEETVVKETVAEAANLSSDSEIDISEIQNEFETAMGQVEVGKSSEEDYNSFISDLVDKNMELEDIPMAEETVSDSDSIGQNPLDLIADTENQDDKDRQASLDAMFGVGQEDKNRENVEIPQPRVAEAPEEELSQDQNVSDDKMRDCINKWNRLQEEFKVAIDNDDVNELVRIKNDLVTTANDISRIEAEKDEELEKAQDENSAAKEEKEQSINAVAQAFANDIKSVISNGNTSISRINTIEEKTAATMVSTQEIKSSTQAIKSVLSEDGSLKSDIGDLNAMLSATGSDNKLKGSYNGKK